MHVPKQINDQISAGRRQVARPVGRRCSDGHYLVLFIYLRLHRNCTPHGFIFPHFVSRAKKREDRGRDTCASIINTPPEIPACLIVALKNSSTPEIRNRDPVIMPFQHLPQSLIIAAGHCTFLRGFTRVRFSRFTIFRDVRPTSRGKCALPSFLAQHFSNCCCTCVLPVYLRIDSEDYGSIVDYALEARNFNGYCQQGILM